MKNETGHSPTLLIFPCVYKGRNNSSEIEIWLRNDWSFVLSAAALNLSSKLRVKNEGQTKNKDKVYL